MTRARCLAAILVTLPAAAGLVPATGEELGLRDWQARAEEILNREWASDPARKMGAYEVQRPRIEVAENAGTPKFDPEGIEPGITVGLDFIRGEIGSDTDALACAIAHEIMHALLWGRGSRLRPSPDPGPQDDTLELGARRDEEFECDRLGLEIAGDANYSSATFIQYLRGRTGDPVSSTDHGPHPSDEQRLAHLEPDRAALWQLVLDYEVGADLLAMGNYDCAASCFESLRGDYQDCPEVLCNLAHARLMQCYANLPEDYWRVTCRYPPPVPPGFSTRLPSAMVPPLRAAPTILERWWHEAEECLRQALEVAPSDPLCLANMGFAHLIRPGGEGPDLGRAREFLARLSEVASDGDLTQMAAVNRAWTMRVSEDPAFMEPLTRSSLTLASGATPTGLAQANLLLLTAYTSPEPKDALPDLERVLRAVPVDTATWGYAMAQHRRNCQAVGQPPPDYDKWKDPGWRRRSAYLSRAETAELPQLELWLGRGDTGLRTPGLLATMPPIEVPLGSPLGSGTLAGYTALRCCRVLDQGLELVFCGGRLVRAKVRSTAGPPVWSLIVQNGGRRSVVRPGDAIEALNDALGPASAPNRAALGDAEEYLYYPDFTRTQTAEPVGVAAGTGPEGLIRALALAVAR